MNMQQKQQQGYNKSMEQQQQHHHQTDSHPLNNCIGDGDGYTQNEQQQPLQHYNFSKDTSQNQYQTYYEGHPSSWPLSPSETTPPQDASRQLYSTSPADGMSPSHLPYSSPSGGGGGGVYASYGDGGGICSPCSPSSPLTREQQEMDTSYTILMGQETSERNACIDGKIEEPHLHDVLCGRGGSINSHPGNRIFRTWVSERKETYMLCTTKSGKTNITNSIFKRVKAQRPPGRFLQKVKDPGRPDPYNISGWWVEIDDTKALAKISQALREGAPAFRATHGKKKKSQQQTKMGSQRKSTRRRPKKRGSMEMMMMMEEGESSPDSPKRKDPPTMPLTPLPAMPSLGLDNTADDTGNSKQELDVLYPTANNVFATQTSGRNNGNGGGNLLSSYPLLHMQDYTASINDVARAIPTPQGSPIQSKKPRATVWPPTPSLNEDPRAPSVWPPPPPSSPPARKEATLPTPTSPEPTRPTQGASSTKFPSVPNTPLVSPGFSPFRSPYPMVNSPYSYGEAKAAWDAIAFLPDLNSPSKPQTQDSTQRAPIKRVHSLDSFSESDDKSICSTFENPFLSDNGNGNGDSKNTPFDTMEARAAAFNDPAKLGISSRHSSRGARRTSSRRASSCSSKSSFSISNHRSQTKRRSIS